MKITYECCGMVADTPKELLEQLRQSPIVLMIWKFKEKCPMYRVYTEEIPY